MRHRSPLIALALLPAAAGASAREYALFQDDKLLVESGDAQRTATLDEVRGLGVDMIKVQLNWAVVAPGSRRKPAGFDATDPAQYPGWARYDSFVADARARGFKVMFALAPPAPGWATAAPGDRMGVNRPSAREFGRFAEAAARLAVSIGVVYDGIKTGKLDARRGPGNRLCIPWTDRVESECRTRITESGHLNPAARRTTPSKRA